MLTFAIKHPWLTTAAVGLIVFSVVALSLATCGVAPLTTFAVASGVGLLSGALTFFGAQRLDQQNRQPPPFIKPNQTNPYLDNSESSSMLSL